MGLLLAVWAGWGSLPWNTVAETAAGSDVTSFVIDPGIRHQTIDNFGANDAWYLRKIGGWSETNRNRLADLLFSTDRGIGLSCWRFYVGAGINSKTIRDPWRTAETFEVAPGQYDWTRQAGERWFLRAARARGVTQFLATVYSPPARLTRNGLSNLGSDRTSPTNLKPGAEEDFARYLTGILTHFRDNPDERERVEFDYVLPVNEPQWDWQSGQEGNRASNGDLRRIYLALGRHLAQAGLKTRILGPESGSLPDMVSLNAAAREKWRADYGDYLRLICADPRLKEVFGGVISYHSYWSDHTPAQLLPHREQLARALARYPGWKLWQSEYCIMEHGRDLSIDSALRVARLIHCDLTVANASAWQWWLAVAGEDYKSGLIHTDYRKPGDPESILESKILWALGNYSRFLRPGMRRVELRGGKPADLEGVMGSAYVNPADGRVVVVFVNLARAPRAAHLAFAASAEQFPAAGRFTTHTTSAADNLREGGPVAVPGGFTLPPRSIVTLVGDNP